MKCLSSRTVSATAVALSMLSLCGCPGGGTAQKNRTNAKPGGSTPAATEIQGAKPPADYRVPNPRKPAAGTPARYVLITNGESPFWSTVRAGMQNAGNELGVKVDMMVNDGTPQGQIDKLRQIGTQSNVLGVGISVTQAGAVGVIDEMVKLQKKGVHVITVDSDVDREMYPHARFAFVGTDNLLGGVELGKCAAGLRSQGGKYITFVGITSAQNAGERIGGFAQGAGDRFEDLGTMGDDIDLSRARDNVRNAIRNHPDLNTLVGIWSYNAPAIVDVVKELNRRKDFTIVTFDAERLAIQAMADGMIDAMVVQNPYEMGNQGVRLLKALAEGDERMVGSMFPELGNPGGNLFDTGLKVVVPDENSPLKRDTFGSKTQFMTLGEFKVWLDKYGLTDS